MSDDKQPEIEVTKDVSEAEKFKNNANDYFKSMDKFIFIFFRHKIVFPQNIT